MLPSADPGRKRRLCRRSENPSPKKTFSPARLRAGVDQRSRDAGPMLPLFKVSRAAAAARAEFPRLLRRRRPQRRHRRARSYFTHCEPKPHSNLTTLSLPTSLPRQRRRKSFEPKKLIQLLTVDHSARGSMKTAASCVSVCESQEYQIHRQVERTLRRRHSHVLPSLLHEGRILPYMHRLCRGRADTEHPSPSSGLTAPVDVASGTGALGRLASNRGVPLRYDGKPGSNGYATRCPG